MKAVRLITAGNQMNLELHDEPLPKPGRHEALVRVHAASLNFRDQAVLNGPYGAATKKNGIPLSDGAGEVVAVGEDVTRVKVGDRVAANCFAHWIGGPFLADYHASSVGFSIDGMLAEHVLLHENAFVHLPDYMSYIEAASLPCAAVTAWSALNLATPLHPGQTVLIQGTGGVALFSLQVARMFGARVLAITSSDEKAEKLKELGAESVVNYHTFPDWDREILALTDGQGVDKVIDIAGEKTTVKSATSAKIRGEITLVGAVSGLGGGLPPVDILFRSLIIGASTIGPRTNFEALLKAMAMHEMRPVIDRVYPFAEFREAYRHIESGKHVGKVVIDVTN
jgi:NADPH:quinone reductase-like Zn-dependent oxidoreductase